MHGSLRMPHRALGARLAPAVFAVPLGVAAYTTQMDTLDSPHAVAQVAVAWAYVAAGLIGWSRRPENPIGRLLVLTGIALLARQLRYSENAVVFTIFFALGDFAYALVAYSALAYPTGRVRDRAERTLVVLGFATAFALPLLTVLAYGGRGRLIGFHGATRDSVVNVFASATVVDVLQQGETVIFFGLLAAAFVGLTIRRFWNATPRMRRILAPLAFAAVAFGLRAIFESVFTFTRSPIAADWLFWWQFTALFALPLTLVAGLLRAHWVRAGVGELVIELEHAQPHELRGALARALGDPTLDLAFWLADRHEYADAAGRSVELPRDGSRAVTFLEADGEPLAAIVHDASLLEEAKLVRAAGAAARLALEKARLQATMRAQLAEVRESRRRVVSAADEERRRIERDLHDGAQQRLAALALQLRTEQRRISSNADAHVDALLEAAVAELQAAGEELRDLVHGIYPAILTEAGLAAALQSLALRNPFPIEVEVPDGRLPRGVEATAYFVACEGVANVTRHAHASKASVRVLRRNGVLEVAISDDGVGGAQPRATSGLTGLAQRVEALGGRFRVDSARGSGTRVVAEIPCES